MSQTESAVPCGPASRREPMQRRGMPIAGPPWPVLIAGARRRGPMEAAPPGATTADESRRTLELALDAAGNIGTFAIDVARDRWTGGTRFAQIYGLPSELAQAGVSTAQVIGCLHPDDRARAALHHASVLAGEAEYRGEYRVGEPDAPPRWVSLRGLRIRERRRRGRIVGVVTDTTPQKEHEARLEALVRERTEALHGAMHKQHLLIEQHPDVLWIMRVERAAPEGEPSFVFEVFNSNTHRQTALDVGLLIERTPHECFPAAMADAIERRYRECVRTRAKMNYFETHDLPIGRRHYDTTLVPIKDADGRVERIIGCARDVTERNSLEEQLRQAQKMEAVGRLCAGVAHDFNNILQSISGALDLLRDDVPDYAEGREFIDIAVKACRRGAHLTHHLLAYTCQQVLQPRVVNVAALLERLVRTLRRTIGPHIQLDFQAPETLLSVHVDAAMFETALINLALNAAYAMRGGGRLTFRLHSRRAAPDQTMMPGLYGVVSAEDTGPGIPPEVLSRVFEPFFTTKGADGAGLGLAMVQGFARQSGGDVAIQSTLGVGTKVEMWLPIARSRAPQGEPTEDESRPAARVAGRALVVDDDEEVLTTTAAFLERAGFEVGTATNGEAALTLLRSDAAWDVLVTDFAMPGLTGLELVRRARDLRPGLPAIIITGHAQGLVEPAQDGAATLCKPFRREQLVALVEAVLGR